MSRSFLWRSLAALLLVAVPSLAQAQTGRIVGTVSDSAKGPVVGAQVIVSPTGLSAVSAADGRVILRGVPAGSYEVRAFRVGYKAATARVLSAGQDAMVAILMTPRRRRSPSLWSALRAAREGDRGSGNVSRIDEKQMPARSATRSHLPSMK